MSGSGIAIIGYGAIGRELVAKLTRLRPDQEIRAVLVRPHHLEGGLASKTNLPFVTDLDALLASHPSLVVECAGGPALADMGAAVLAAGCDLVAASSGALVNDALRESLAQQAAASGTRLLVPSGAIGAVDALSAMRLAGLDKVVYRGIKPPGAWLGSAAEAMCDLSKVARRTVFFTGTAREAAATFPKNANVAAIVGMAGTGLDDTRAELIADPTARQNCHEVEAEGLTGAFSLRIAGNPSPENPRTSALTAYSILNATLTRTAAVVFG